MTCCGLLGFDSKSTNKTLLILSVRKQWRKTTTVSCLNTIDFVPFWSVSRNISKRNLEETGPCTWYIKGYTTIMRLNLLSSFESDRGKSAKLWGWNLICQTNHYNLISWCHHLTKITGQNIIYIYPWVPWVLKIC